VAKRRSFHDKTGQELKDAFQVLVGFDGSHYRRQFLACLGCMPCLKYAQSLAKLPRCCGHINHTEAPTKPSIKSHLIAAAARAHVTLPRFKLLTNWIFTNAMSAPMMTSCVVNEMVCGPRNTADAPNTIANSKTMMARIRRAFSFIAAVYCKLLKTHALSELLEILW
jgi:hypothetical protein